ncbi:MAG: hypothetical protein H6880_05120 [Rhodobiaceae bacterium]|nr:hypothetical protein [Rhodobiaceae bacterium]
MRGKSNPATVKAYSPAVRETVDPFAVAFYEAMGMRITGESPSGSIPGRMLPRMQRRL